MYKKLKAAFRYSFLLFYILGLGNYENRSLNTFFGGVCIGIIVSFCIGFFIIGYYEKENVPLKTN